MLFILSLWQIMMTLGVANLDHRGMVGRIYKGVNLTLLHTKTNDLGIMVSEKVIFLCFSYYKSMRANDPLCFIYLFIYLFIQYLMRVAQLAVNSYSTLWPSQQNTTIYIFTYI